MANVEEPVEDLFKIQSEAAPAANAGKCLGQHLEDGGGLGDGGELGDGGKMVENVIDWQLRSSSTPQKVRVLRKGSD